MKEIGDSERCKVIIVEDGNNEVLTVNLPYGQDTLLKVLHESLKPYNITTDTVNEVQLTEKYAEHVFVRIRIRTQESGSKGYCLPRSGQELLPDTSVRWRMSECFYSDG